MSCWRLAGSFAESYIKIGRFEARQPLFFFSLNTLLRTLQTISVDKMTTLLHIAARVEAAILAYVSVRDFADKGKWLAKFKEERVSTHLNGIISINLRSK